MDEQITDAALVAEARSGDTGAFDQLVRRHFPLLFAIARIRLRDREAAEELAQEVILRAWLNLDQLRDADTFGGWAASLARNLAIDWQRKEIRSSKLVTFVPMENTVMAISDKRTPDARATAATRQERRLIDDAIASLHHEHRELIGMHYSRELSHRQIARRLGVHHTTVARRLERALSALRQAVDSEAKGGGLHPLQPSETAATHACALVAVVAALSPEAKAALVALSSGTTAAATGGGAAATLLGGATPSLIGKVLVGGLVLGGLGAGTWYAASRSVSAPVAASAPAAPSAPGPILRYAPGSELVFRLKSGEKIRVQVDSEEAEIQRIDFTRLPDGFTRLDVQGRTGSAVYYMLPFEVAGPQDFDVPNDRLPCEFDLLVWYTNASQAERWDSLSVLESEPEKDVFEFSLHAASSAEFLEESQRWFDEYFQGRMSLRDAQQGWLDQAERAGVLPQNEEHRRRYRETRHVWNP